MCNTDEHIDIGDTAQKSIPAYLAEAAGLLAKGSTNYDSFLSWWKAHNQGDDDECLVLHNRASVSYGDILAMTGDYYKNFSDMDTIDRSSWDNRVKNEEIKMITSLYRNYGKDPNATESSKFKLSVQDEDEHGDFFVHMALLATTNTPHFMPEAITIWLKWHEKALAIVKAARDAVEAGNPQAYIDAFNAGGGADNPADHGGPDPSLADYTSAPFDVDVNSAEFVIADSLVRAFKYNAFADHFLSDMWAAGHMRVMRQAQKSHFNAEIFDVSQTLRDASNSLEGKAATVLLLMKKIFAQMEDDKGINLGDITSGIHHDEDGNRGLWYTLLLGGIDHPELGRLDSVFALGDGTFISRDNNTAGDIHNRNELNRKICITSICNSVRDICLASALGSRFDDFRKTDAYWKCLGDDVGKRPLYAALRLFPKPNPPDHQYTDVYAERAVNRSNHYPLVAPSGNVSKIEDRYTKITALLMNGTDPGAMDEECWMREIDTTTLVPISVAGVSLPVAFASTGTALTPGFKCRETYWDMRAAWVGQAPIEKLSDEELGISRIEAFEFADSPVEQGLKDDAERRAEARKVCVDGWRNYELFRLVAQYVNLKFKQGQHYDNVE